MSIIKNKLVKRGSEHLKMGKPISFLCGLIFFIISRTNLHVDNLRYMLANIRNSDDCAVVTINNNLMQIDFSDNGISKELYLHNKREHFSTDYIHKFIGTDDIIIDVGGNIGYYALLESQLASNGKIYAIEPVPSNIKLLNKNIKLNDYKNISTFQLAMGDKDGKAKMYVYDKCNWCSFTKDSTGNIIDEIEVPIMTLDGFVESYVCQYPTFIRMDAEGYEYQIIKGASKIFEKKNPLKLCIELHPHLMPKENMKELVNTLMQSDFKIAAIFLESTPHNYKNITVLNGLTRIMGGIEYGFVGNSYDDLNELLKDNYYTPMVFFERSHG